MSLTIHQLALRLAKHIGVTAFDPGDVSNTNPLLQAGARGGDLDDVVACINGALQELWALAPRGVRALYPDSGGCWSGQRSRADAPASERVGGIGIAAPGAAAFFDAPEFSARIGQAGDRAAGGVGAADTTGYGGRVSSVRDGDRF